MPVELRILIFSYVPDLFWGPTIPLSNRYKALSPGVKLPGREAHNSPPTSAKVKKILINTSTPPYVFMA
jgi:hypothetical protein